MEAGLGEQTRPADVEVGALDAGGRVADLALMVARWDLLLWSPYFLIWGLLWLATALHLRRSRFTAGRGFGGGR